MTGHYIVFESAGKTVLRNFEIPSLKDDEVLLENEYTVVSAGTEVANLLCRPNTVTAQHGFPFTPGYSGAGRVAAVGKAVESLKVGNRVIITWGGHCSHTVKKADTVLKIEDDSIDLLDAAFAHIASFSFLGVRKLKIELGESVMIAGMGILGAFAVQIANLSGAIPVIAADLSPARRELALKFGASVAFSPADDDFVEKVTSASGGNGRMPSWK
jgi:threonine dehydrogenase-like Zn-dependent dehydrogenase